MGYKHLTLEQRYEIKAYLKCDKSQKFIAEQLGVSESCISRELRRNKLKRGGYNAKKAQEQGEILFKKSIFYLENKNPLPKPF